jgi:ATP-dependent DNA helicase PIF1
MLNEMRLGVITNETVSAFRKLSRRIQYEDSLEATELCVCLAFLPQKMLITVVRFPTRNEVENSNAFRMRDLHGKAYRFEALDTGSITDLNIREKLLANMMAPKVIELKKGAQVMLIKNMDDGLVNGSLGKVIAFMSKSTFEIYEKNPEVFDEGISTDDLDDSQREARHKFKHKLSWEQPGSALPETTGLLPLVKFSVADGTTRDLLVQHEDWKVELPNGEVQAQRHQLPLILAWALSIHKAQGQTLERVKIDLKRVFEKGQAYVALSRATSQAGLEVHNFDKSKVMAHPRVTSFYTGLYSVNKAMEHPKVAKAIPAKRKDRVYEEDEDGEAALAAAYAG